MSISFSSVKCCVSMHFASIYFIDNDVSYGDNIGLSQFIGEKNLRVVEFCINFVREYLAENVGVT